MNNIILKYDTKQPLPVSIIELEPKDNNKDIYKINKLINTTTRFEPPRPKRNISQCFRCQAYGCQTTQKTTATSNRPTSNAQKIILHLQQSEIENVRCYNCKRNHPASYKGCIICKNCFLP